MDGKFFGTVAFIVTEVIVVLSVIGVIVGLINEIDISIPASGILTLQGAVFATVWGSVATKNFKR